MSAFCQQVNLVKEIVVQGNNRVSKQAILAAMTTKVGQTYSQANLDQDRRNLEDLGFFEAVDVRGAPVESGSNWLVTVNITEYPVIKEFRITGNTVVPTADIVKAITLKAGTVFNLREGRPTAAAIRKLYADRGYYCDIDQPFGPSRESPGTVDITIVETKVGNVSVQGAKLTKPWVMQHLIKTRPGETLSMVKWTNDLRRMLATQWFESANSVPDSERQLGVVDLTADVKEAKTGQFNVGVQVDPRSSFAGFVRYSQNNVGGTGQSYDISYLQATQGGGPSVDLGYSNPFFKKTDTSMQVALYSRVRYMFQNGLFSSGSSLSNENSYTERRTGGSLGFSHPDNDYVTSGISMRVENVITSGVGATTVVGNTSTNNFVLQDGPVAIATAGVSIDHRDNPNDPSRGYWARVELQPGYSDINRVGGSTWGTNIIGPNYFGKMTLDYRAYFSREPKRTIQDLSAPRHTFALRVRYGTTAGNVPFFEQYFAGGVDTLRGYADDRFWGRQMLMSTLEYRHPLQKAFYLIGFIDYGGAWDGYGSINDYTQSNKMNMHLGYGPGLSFSTPLGNIQVYLGFDSQGKSRTHFFIGKSF